MADNAPKKLDGEILSSMQRAEAIFEKARQLSLLCTGTSVEMERILREIYKALSFESGVIPFHMLLARTFRQCLDFTSALYCYRLVLKIDSSNLPAKKAITEVLIMKGKEYMIIGQETKSKSKYIAACACFDEALEFARENSELWTLKAICHVQCEQLLEAWEAITKVIKPSGYTPPEVYILRAKINWGRGLVEQGNQDIRAAGALQPNHPEVEGFIARSYAKSEKLYKEALVCFTAKKYKESLEHIDHALYITNDDVKLHLMKAKLHRVMSDLQSAYEAVLKAKELFLASYSEGDFTMHLPHEIQKQINLILNEMALQFASTGDYDNAILLWNRIIREEHSSAAISVLPMDPQYFVNRADCYRALHRLDDAIIDYQDALAIHPDDWNIKTKLSLTYYLIATDDFNASKFRETDVGLSNAIHFNPKVSEYYALRGRARYYLNAFYDAYRDFKRALKLDPQNAEIKQRLQQFENNDSFQLQRDAARKLRRSRGLRASTASSSRLDQADIGDSSSDEDGDDDDAARKKSATSSSSRPEKTKKTAAQELVEQARKQLKGMKFHTDSTYTNEKTVWKLNPTDDDRIAMMLHPREGAKLPTLKLLSSEDRVLSTVAAGSPAMTMTAHSVSAGGKRATASTSVGMSLPAITMTLPSKLKDAYSTSMKVKEKCRGVKTLLDARPDLNRSTPWSIVDVAMEGAKQNVKVTGRRKKG